MQLLTNDMYTLAYYYYVFSK